MSANSRRVVEKALSMREHYFPDEHYGAHPYCASFVRWLFKTSLGIEFPIVSHPPYYQKLGISYPVGKWFADSLAGNEIGEAIPESQMQPGDILFFRDTCGGYKAGTITHVGVCVGTGGMMADAGSDNKIHIRSHRQFFPNLLVEVRRPRALKMPVLHGIELSLKSKQIKATNRGTRVSNLDIEIALSGGLNISVNKTRIPFKVVNLNIAVTESIRMAVPAGRFGEPFGTGLMGGISSKIQSAPHGAHVKLFHHDHKSSATIGGSMVGSLKLRILYQNHALHIWINNKETRASAADITIV